MTYEFCVFGPITARFAGTDCALGSPKQRAVLALLLMSANQVVSCDRIVAELWADDPPETAATTLQSYVSRIRSNIFHAARGATSATGDRGTQGSAAAHLRREGRGYVLAVRADTVDAHRLEPLVALARSRLVDHPADTARALDRALADCRGEPFAEIQHLRGSGLAAEAQRLRELVLAAEEVRIEAMLRCGEATAAAAQVATLTVKHPLRESLHALSLLALYRSGRQAEGLAGYERLRRRLRDELGVDPCLSLRSLQAQLLRQDPALDWEPGTHGAAAPVRTGSRPVLDWAPATHGAATPVRTGSRPAPYGPVSTRRSPAARLDAAVFRPSCTVQVLAGEAGIGKTWLLESLAVRAGMDMDVGWGRSDEARQPPFWPWVEALRSLQPAVNGEALAGALAPSTAERAVDRFHRFDAFADQLVDRARSRPLLVILEDLQWADDSTLELFGVVARRADAAQLAVVGSYRPEGVGPTRPLAGLLARLVRLDHTERIELGPLDAAGVAELLATVTGSPPTPERVSLATSRCDGNPFLLRELARHVMSRGAPASAWHEVPPSVRAVVAQRVGRLPRPTRRLLEIAASVGRSCDHRLLAAVSRQTLGAVERALGAAVRAGLVTEHALPEAHIRFRHSMTFEALAVDQRPIARATTRTAIAELAFPLPKPRVELRARTQAADPATLAPV